MVTFVGKVQVLTEGRERELDRSVQEVAPENGSVLPGTLDKLSWYRRV